jgi:hypothetical protein
MGKKKKSFYKKSLKPFMSDNSLFLAALGGMAAGISIATILGTEKAKQIVETIEGTAKDFKTKISNSLNSDNSPSTFESGGNNGARRSFEAKES